MRIVGEKDMDRKRHKVVLMYQKINSILYPLTANEDYPAFPFIPLPGICLFAE